MPALVIDPLRNVERTIKTFDILVHLEIDLVPVAALEKMERSNGP